MNTNTKTISNNPRLHAASSGNAAITKRRAQTRASVRWIPLCIAVNFVLSFVAAPVAQAAKAEAQSRVATRALSAVDLSRILDQESKSSSAQKLKRSQAKTQAKLQALRNRDSAKAMAQLVRRRRISPSAVHTAGRVPTLLNNAGQLAKPVSVAQVAIWKQEIKQGKVSISRVASLHLWLGEYELAQNRDPNLAQWHFRQSQLLTHSREAGYGLAAYDSATALFYAGAYQQATNAFQHLLSPKCDFSGYSRQACAFWLRQAGACASYHRERTKLGIPEPPRLDPLCGVAALATCVRALGLPASKHDVLPMCRMTGEGNNMDDLVAGGKRLGLNVRTVKSDDTGLIALPKPLIAYVEHDHFIAVTRADKEGVSYLCSDCGPWPGGTVNLTWKQWHALEAGLYGVVTKPGSATDKMLSEALVDTSHQKLPAQLGGTRATAVPLSLAPITSTRVAYTGALSRLGHVGVMLRETGLASRKLALVIPILKGHVVPILVSCTAADCGLKPGCGEPPFPAHSPFDGEPVNLATGEEQHMPSDDIDVYNPNGLPVTWKRVYNSLRSPGGGYPSGDISYECNDFGIGWSHSYNITLQIIGLTVLMTMPNGSKQVFLLPDESGTATAIDGVSGQPQFGEKMSLYWNYHDDKIYVTMPSRTVFVFVGPDTGTGCYHISQAVDRNGHALNFTYGSPAPGFAWPLLTSISDGTSNKTLLKISRNSHGEITQVSDCYGRSVYYHVQQFPTLNVLPIWTQYYPELDSVSEIVPGCSPNPPLRYVYGYTYLPTGDSDEQVSYLHTITTPATTPSGISTLTINYNSDNYVASTVDGVGNQHTYNYLDGTHTKVTVKDSGNNAVYSYTAGFDSKFNQTTITDGTNTQVVSTQTYSDTFNPYSPTDFTDGNLNKWIFVYDNYGYITKAYSPRGRSSHTNQYGINIIDPGLTTTYSYDTNSPLEQVTQIQESTATTSNTPVNISYYDNGLVHSIFSPVPGGTHGSSAQVHTDYTYDSLGNPTTVTMPGTDTTSTISSTFNYTSDTTSSGTYSQPEAMGEVLSVSDNLGKTTHFRYDSQGNVITTIDALGNRTDTSYTIANQPWITMDPATGQQGTGQAYTINTYLYPDGPLMNVQAWDERNSTTPNPPVYPSGFAAIRQIDYGWDAEGHETTTTVSDPNTSTSTVVKQLQYDAMYRVTGVADGNSQFTHCTFNQAGYMATIAYPNSNTFTGYDITKYTSYDPAGHLLQRVDGRGITTNYVYNDPESKLTGIQYPASLDLNVAVTYDGFGRPATRTDSTAGLFNADGTVNTPGVLFSYDDRDVFTQIDTKYQSAATGTLLPTKTIQYAFNANGSRHSMTTPGGTFTYGYDQNGRLSSLTNPFSETSQWHYWDNGQLLDQELGNGVTTSYTYNPLGQITDLQTRQTNVGTSALLSEYSNLGYDGAGNLVAQTANIPTIAGGTTNSSFGGGTNYTYDYKDELTKEQSTRTGSQASGYTNNFVSDNAQNGTTFRSTTSNSFNADNQITSFGDSAGVSLGSFAYDGNGNPSTYKGRTLSFDPENRLTDYSNGGTSLLKAGYNSTGLRGWKQIGTNTATRTYFLYDETLPVCELDSSGNVTAVNTFGSNGLLSRHANSATTYYTFDLQGSVTRRLDSSGNITGTTLFDAFGARDSADTSTDPFSGFGGQWGYYRDAETGLSLLTLRYYDPQTGRFVTRDPMGYDGGLNLYAYTGNNPTNFIDPNGLDITTLDGIELVANLGGEIPVVGGAFDLASAGISLYKGDCIGAALSIAAIAPGVGSAFAGLKIARNAKRSAEVINDCEHSGGLLKACANGGCFVAGTPVQMTDGTTKPIEDVKMGDAVMSRDPETGEMVSHRVEGVSVHDVHAVVTITLADAKTGKVVDSITCTENHPFYVAGQGFTPAGSLCQGNSIVTRAGPSLIVKSIERKQQDAGYKVYNFTVENTHTYFVGLANNGIWVHNTDCPLRYKSTWGTDETAAADDKISCLNEAANTHGGLSETPVNRVNGSAKRYYQSQGNYVPPGSDVDHTLDLQLGGQDSAENMSPLNQSVNRSLGPQIDAFLKRNPGVVITRFTIGW